MADAHTLMKDRATLNEARLAHEFNLGGQRMSWLVTSQAFLFAAWVQAIKESHLSDDLKYLIGLVPSVGILVAIIGWVAVLAAQRVTDHLVAERAKYDEPLQLLGMGLDRDDDWTRLLGHLPGAVLPPVFGLAWASAMLQHYTHWPVLYVSAPAVVALACWVQIWRTRRDALFVRLKHRVKTDLQKELKERHQREKALADNNVRAAVEPSAAPTAPPT